jgi:hypothetical protein
MSIKGAGLEMSFPFLFISSVINDSITNLPLQTCASIKLSLRSAGSREKVEHFLNFFLKSN